jgi:hypothetical protein
VYNDISTPVTQESGRLQGSRHAGTVETEADLHGGKINDSTGSVVDLDRLVVARSLDVLRNDEVVRLPPRLPCNNDSEARRNNREATTERTSEAIRHSFLQICRDSGSVLGRAPSIQRAKPTDVAAP